MHRKIFDRRASLYVQINYYYVNRGTVGKYLQAGDSKPAIPLTGSEPTTDSNPTISLTGSEGTSDSKPAIVHTDSPTGRPSLREPWREELAVAVAGCERSGKFSAAGFPHTVWRDIDGSRDSVLAMREALNPLLLRRHRVLADVQVSAC